MAAVEEAKMKQCPFCAETVLAEAKKCRYCGEIIDEPLRALLTANAQPRWNPGIAAVLSLAVPGAGQLYKYQVELGFRWFKIVVGVYILGVFIHGLTYSSASLIFFIGLVLHLGCVYDAAKNSGN